MDSNKVEGKLGRCVYVLNTVLYGDQDVGELSLLSNRLPPKTYLVKEGLFGNLTWNKMSPSDIRDNMSLNATILCDAVTCRISMTSYRELSTLCRCFCTTADEQETHRNGRRIEELTETVERSSCMTDKKRRNLPESANQGVDESHILSVQRSKTAIIAVNHALPNGCRELCEERIRVFGIMQMIEAHASESLGTMMSEHPEGDSYCKTKKNRGEVGNEMM
ncbi:uncharacterized protein EDB93DRAFT_1338688 [Suillus bovinus]|uniref:uncharacterized protein n=1 Tax=Suillus bovinus TaxID=48563 RepID=UPI001B872984|nr:uncharacterized protein EDB93DRAFT_1338688 [Suillus bovinus]KAG2141200.1 hypothetical protein EDB93DRAFT_1338688 [Suillus bovinus]